MGNGELSAKPDKMLVGGGGGGGTCDGLASHPGSVVILQSLHAIETGISSSRLVRLDPTTLDVTRGIDMAHGYWSVTGNLLGNSFNKLVHCTKG